MIQLFKKNKYDFLIITFLLVLRFASSATADFSFIFLAFYAFLGPQKVIYSFFISWLFIVINPSLFPAPSLASLGRLLVVFFGFFSIMLYNTRKKPFVFNKINSTNLFLGLLFIIHSIFVSKMPDISLLKSFLWLITIWTLFSAWLNLSPKERQNTIAFITGLTSLLMVISIPLMFTSHGYAVNGRGYQGILNHPQALGIVLAVLSIWYTAQILASKKPSFEAIFLVAIFVALMMMTQSRTALISYLIALGITFIVQLIYKPFRRKRFVLFFDRYENLIVFFIFVMLIIVFLPDLFEGWRVFLIKGNDSESLLLSYSDSRGFLIENMFRNIRENFLYGIGFGLPSIMTYFVVSYDPLFGLPVGASIEKGVMFIALLEETGLIIFFVTLLWFFFMFLRALKNGFLNTSIFLVILALNSGESTFFSPSGMGMLLLIYFSWAVLYEESNY